ncbi:hypothetical protein VP1G_10525 [Cytospora mali]|uniref:Uncharacterized protein n=1 Tax=Cytospora mali TaxID=578113 RepID=A0A194UP17_CYTMA|nr:hypothetical protein VP1G_10525 [Valsa mali var. pyri (nom. inval.)]
MTQGSGSKKTHSSSSQRSSGGSSARSGMMERYMYDTSSYQDRLFQPGPAPTPEQQRRDTQRYLDSLGRQIGGNGTNPPPRK